MIEVINNPWVVGIGGGTLSGLAVTFFSKKWLTKRDDKEFRQKVAIANQEILYAIRPCISESILPTKRVIIRVIVATARKYELEKRDLLTSVQVLQNLIKEVMDSSFISAKEKHRYCEMLSDLIDPPKQANTEENKQRCRDESEIFNKSVYSDYRSNLLTSVSIMLGLVVAVLSVFMFVSQSKQIYTPTANTALKFISTVLPTVISVVSIALVSSGMRLLSRKREQNSNVSIIAKENIQIFDKQNELTK
jgi:hypothetical protein